MYCQLNSLCVEMAWFNCCTLITQCATGVQPHPAPKSIQTGPGAAAVIHTHTLFCMFNGELNLEKKQRQCGKLFGTHFICISLHTFTYIIHQV